jgi:hypothetical protein
VLCLSLVAACGDDAAGPGTTAAPTAEAVAAYCAVLEGAPERSGEDTMEMLSEVALPGAAELLDRLMRYAGSGEDIAALGDFNEATCGIRFP